MNDLMASAIKLAGDLRRPASKVPWNPDEPRSQPYYTFDTTTSSWSPESPSTGTAKEKTSTGITNLAIFTWNIDFMLPFAEARMKPALAHLDRLTSPDSLPETTAPIIFLQECTPADLDTIAATPWVRERFHLTDRDPTNWATTLYGTTTLVDARLPIAAAFRVHYSKTRMDRDALFADVLAGPDGSRVRLCNTHLESLALEPPLRPAQMQLVARHLHEATVVHAGLVAGDFNAIQPLDRTLHADGGNDLKDAFLELGGSEDADEGFTWGQQAATKLREQFGCSRMDKVYFCGGVKLVRFERFGADVLTEGEEEQRQIVELGFEKPWVTDHLGVMAEVEIVPSGQGPPPKAHH